MKQCPKCSTTYDENMSFCLNDGATLVSQTTPDMPATVMFNPQQSSQTAQNETPAPTMLAGAPPQSYGQQPQFGQQQQPSFNQPNWSTPAAPAPKKSYLGIIVVAALLIFGFLGIAGALLLYYFAQFEPNDYSGNTSNTGTNTTTYSQDTSQGELKNGFKQISIEDVTARKFFPTANKTSAATYESGSERVVSFLSVYNSPADAEAAFQKHLDQLLSEGKTITTRKENYVYYKKGNSHSTAFYLSNKLYEYSTNNEQTLYRFAK
jgi:hypothetical protein